MAHLGRTLSGRKREDGWESRRPREEEYAGTGYRKVTEYEEMRKLVSFFVFDENSVMARDGRCGLFRGE